MHTYEIEIKSLLGSPESAEALRVRMRELDPSCALRATNKQRNHYFTGGELSRLYESVAVLFDTYAQSRLQRIVEEGHDVSVRTRQKDNNVLLVVKASLDDTTSENGITRIEFEEPVPNLSLDELDQKVLDAGYTYQAKWSREREEYRLRDVDVTIDRNAGYGYLAEFEIQIDDPEHATQAQETLRTLMKELAVEELSQDRLQRMFEHYNAHWRDYYGTEKIFNID